MAGLLEQVREVASIRFEKMRAGAPPLPPPPASKAPVFGPKHYNKIRYFGQASKYRVVKPWTTEQQARFLEAQRVMDQMVYLGYTMSKVPSHPSFQPPPMPERPLLSLL